jgi:ABC-2 type transport system permease protein
MRLKGILLLAYLEWKSFWTSPAGGLSLLVFLVLSGLVVYNTVAAYAAVSLEGLSRGVALDARLVVFSGSLEELGLILMLVAPLTTMRAYALSSQGGCLDLLLSLPLSRLEIVLGRFLGSAASLMALALLSFLSYALLIFRGVGDLPLLAVASLGFLLLISSFSAVGLAVSARTGSPLASALSTLGILGVLWAAGFAAPYLSPKGAFLLQGVAFGPRLGHFAIGLVDLNDVIYFLVLSLAGLFLAKAYPD